MNVGRAPLLSQFDPYPFSLLGMIVAVEAVLLSSFILMRQNRMAKRGERRDHLNLQIDLIAEKRDYQTASDGPGNLRTDGAYTYRG